MLYLVYGFVCSYGAKSLSLSKLVNLICKLLEDQNSQVGSKLNEATVLLSQAITMFIYLCRLVELILYTAASVWFIV